MTEWMWGWKEEGLVERSGSRGKWEILEGKIRERGKREEKRGEERKGRKQRKGSECNQR